MKANELRIHSLLPATLSNGPGLRCAIWVQGCSLKCQGCFNPETHSFESGEIKSVEQLLAWIMSLGDIEGVTVSGGEPLQQADAVLTLLENVRFHLGKSAILFTGFEWDELIQMGLIERIKGCADVLITGRYEEKERVAKGLVGSRNKLLKFFSARYSPSDFQDLAVAEVVIGENGEIVSTGIDPVRMTDERSF